MSPHQLEGLEKYGPFVGRILIGLIFLVSGLTKVFQFSVMEGYMRQNGMLAATGFFLACALLIEIVGAVFLMLGWYTRVTALFLTAYLVPVTLIFHNFWSYAGAEQQVQIVNFLKNLAIMGGLVYAASTGARAVSIDRRLGREPPMTRVHA